MRQLITTLLEVVGLTAMSVAAWSVDPAFGLATAGAAAVGVGYFEGRK